MCDNLDYKQKEYLKIEDSEIKKSVMTLMFLKKNS